MHIGGIMGYISVFGTVSVALTLALAASSTNAPAQETQGITIDVAIKGLRNLKGNLLICLTTDVKAYPDCGKGKSAYKLKIATRDHAQARFTNVVPGTYHMTLLHDENLNNKMDIFLGIPKEGFALSRNPKILFSVPPIAKARFVVAAENLHHMMRMKYIL
jgi:uncharacterized protein (DUF2141 family)